MLPPQGQPQMCHVPSAAATALISRESPRLTLGLPHSYHSLSGMGRESSFTTTVQCLLQCLLQIT